MKLIISFACILLVAIAHGQNFNAGKLDSLFNSLTKNNLAIGSVAISSGGKIIYQRSFGKGQDATTEYRIGSITKVFTAVLVYQCIEEGKLLLTDKLSNFFPELPGSNAITIAQLLGHRSGLANFTNNTNYDEWKDKPKTHDELLAMIKNQPPDFAPGGKADYNNSNYLLLSYMLEKIYKLSYKDIVTARVIKKLGLTHTYYGSKAGFQPNEAISYKYFNNEWKQDRAAYLDNFSGAGAILSTPADMLHFINALFTGKLISRASLDTMKAIRDGYGMGLFPYGDEQYTGFGHNGKTEGFGSSLQYYPQNNIAIAYCTNGEVYPKAEILDDIFAVCFNKPVAIPSFTPVTVAAGLLNSYTGLYSDTKTGMQLTSTLDSGRLILNVKGQPFTLQPLSNNLFWNIPFGFFFQFRDSNELVIRDVDDVYVLHKKAN